MASDLNGWPAKDCRMNPENIKEFDNFGLKSAVMKPVKHRQNIHFLIFRTPQFPPHREHNR